MKKMIYMTTTITAVSFILLTGCGQQNASTNGSNAGASAVQNHNQSASTSSANAGATPLSVLYAGSMTNVMEKHIDPDAKTNLHIDVKGEGKGSSALAQMIKSHLASPDVFISASPSVNKADLMGGQNHNLVNWYMTLAQDQLVIAYSPKSKFKRELELAAKGTQPWYEVLQAHGFRFGRTDPKLDPKGVDTILMMKLADSYYHQPNLAKNILGSDENPNQVFPEETLVAQLTSGQVDAIIAYKHEAIEWGVPYITLPKEINLGDASLATQYATVKYTSSSGKTESGAPIVFTITIPSTVQHERAAEQFVKYMEVGNGHQLLMKDGFTPIALHISGNPSAVPSMLKSLSNGAGN